MKDRDFFGMPFNLKNDAVVIQTERNDSTQEKNVKERGWSERTVILAIPSNRHFLCLCYAVNPTQCLQYLNDEFDLSLNLT